MSVIKQFFRTSRFHMVMTVLWVLLLVPSLMFWSNSVMWVVFMSLYANVVGHWGAYQAARADELNESSPTEE